MPISSRDAMSSRDWPVDLALTGLILLAYYAWPLLAPGLEYRGGDPTLLTYPNRQLFVDSIRQGVLPLWNPYAGCGVPALAAYQGAFLYPPHLLLLLFPSVLHASRSILFLHYLLQAAGMYGLARFGFALGRGAAVFAAVALGVSAYNAAHVEHFMIVATASWTPMILWAWISFLKRPGARPLLATAAALAMAILAGHTQYWLYTLDVMALLALVQPVRTSGRISQFVKTRLRAFAALAVVGAAAFVLAGAQLLPTLELAGRSERLIDPGGYGAHSSFPAEYLWHFLAPGRLPVWDQVDDPFRNPAEMACFLGRITLLLAFVGLLRLPRLAAVKALVVWAAAAVVLALGEFGPAGGALFRLAENTLPGWQGLRVPARLLFVAGIALILLAAHGLDWLSGLVRGSAKSGESAAKSGDRHAFKLPKASQSPFFAPFFAGFSLGGVLAACCCLIVLVEQVPVSWRLPLRHPIREAIVPPGATLAEWLAERPGEYRLFRLLDTVDIRRSDALAGAARIANLEPNSGVYAGVGTVHSYVEGLLPLLRTEDFLRAYWRNLYTPRPDAELLGLMNVRYLAADKPVEGADWRLVAQIAPCEPGRRWATVYENSRARQRVFWAADAESRHNLAALDGAYEDTGHPSPRAQTPRPLATADDSARSSSPNPPPAIRRLSPNRLEVSKPPEVFGDLLFAASAYPGWKACRPAGAELLQPVNAIHSRFHAPAGVDRIELRFEPFSFRLGLFLTLMALGALSCALCLTRSNLPPPSNSLDNV